MILPLLAVLMLQGCDPDPVVEKICNPSHTLYHRPDSVELFRSNVTLPESICSGYFEFDDCINYPPVAPDTCKKGMVRIEGDCLFIPFRQTGRAQVRFIWGSTMQIDSATGLPVVTIYIYGPCPSPIEEVLGYGYRKLDLTSIKNGMVTDHDQVLIDLRIYPGRTDWGRRTVAYTIK